MNAVVASLAQSISAAAQQDTRARCSACKPALDQLVAGASATSEKGALVPPSILPPFLVALGSVAGGGKTTGSAKIAAILNSAATEAVARCKQQNNQGDDATKVVVATPCFVVPLDGYHLYRRELDALPNAEEAHRRRGAPFTFSSTKYLRDVTALTQRAVLKFPKFEHEEKDPVEEAIDVDATSRLLLRASQNNDSGNGSDEALLVIVVRPVVLVEGIYALYAAPDAGEGSDDKNWEAARDMFNLLVYLRVDIDRATERLTRRHMRAWNISEAEARLRAAGSDRDNGMLVIAAAERLIAANRGNVIVADSVEDEEYAKQ